MNGRTRNARFALFAALFMALAGFVVSCGDDNPAGPDQAAVIARGNYIVNHVAACIDCHTPRTITGELDMTKLLSGTPFADLDPFDGAVGLIWAPNLTPDSTGLKSWTDAQIKDAFQNGVDDSGEPLFPIMPYFVFHNMTADDASAVVAYLRSIPAINNPVPERQPLGFPFTTAAQPIPAASIPVTTLAASDPHYNNAVRGRYLAAFAGVCIECHTAPAQGPVPVKLDSIFAGGRGFGAEELGVPTPPFPAVIWSANITPDSTGIIGDTAEQIRTLLLTGIDPDGQPICPPMPAGPGAAFGGLTAQDALDIGWYVTTIPPLVHTVPDCHVPPAP